MSWPKGRPRPLITRHKISTTLTGMAKTAEHIANMRVAHQMHWTPEIVQAACDSMQAGASAEATARHIGISGPTFRAWWKRREGDEA